jgi:hypothetical protein
MTTWKPRSYPAAASPRRRISTSSCRASSFERITGSIGCWAAARLIGSTPTEPRCCRFRRGRLRSDGDPRGCLEEFDLDHTRVLKRDTIAHLGTLNFVAAKENVVPSPLKLCFILGPVEPDLGQPQMNA